LKRLERAADRDVGGVVEVEAEKRPFGSSSPITWKRSPPIRPYRPAVVVAEELLA